MLTQTAEPSPTPALSPQLESRLRLELTVYQALKHKRDDLDAAMNLRKRTVETYLMDESLTTATVDGISATRVSPTRTYLDEKKLIALGVSTAQLDQCRVTVPVKPYLSIRVKGEKHGHQAPRNHDCWQSRLS